MNSLEDVVGFLQVLCDKKGECAVEELKELAVLKQVEWNV